MQITFTPSARNYLAEQNAQAVTISPVLFASCCSGPLPPTVKPETPDDADGFLTYEAENLTIYFDSLLDPRPEIVVDLKEFPMYRELFIQGWE